MNAELQHGKKIVERLSEKVTLKMFQIGCDSTNYGILQSLPLTAGEIEQKIDLTPMPTNKRINDLMEVRLVSREKAGEKIKLTLFGKDFLKLVEDIKEKVIRQMAEMI